MQIVADIKTSFDNEAKRFGVSGRDKIFVNSQKLAILKPAVYLLFRSLPKKKHY